MSSYFFLLLKPKKLLATILILNNFLNIAVVILFASIDNPFLSSINNVFVETLIEVGVIGLIILFFGEILPKIYANRNPLIFSKIIALPIYFLDRYLLFFLNVPMSKITFFFESSLIKNRKNISVDKIIIYNRKDKNRERLVPCKISLLDKISPKLKTLEIVFVVISSIVDTASKIVSNSFSCCLRKLSKGL